MIEVPSRKYNIGRWQVDCIKMTIANEQESIQLSAKVFELLKLFIVSSDHIVSKDDAIEKVWLNNIGVGKTGFPNAVWFLRKVFTDLGAENDEVFVTIQKVGYQLIAFPQAIEDNNVNAILQPKRTIKTLLITLAALLTTTVLYGFYPYNSQVTETVLKAQHFEIKRLTNFEGVEEDPDISPDGKLMAFHWRQENMHSQIYVMDLTNNDAALRLITNNNAEEVSPVWSPDGQSLAYIRIYNNGECQIRSFHLISNLDKFIDSGCSLNKFIRSLDWSQDGKYLIYPKVLGDRVAVFRYKLESKTTQQITWPKTNQSDGLAVFIENSEKIALIRKDNRQAKLIITNADSKNEHSETVVLKEDNTMIGLAWDQRNRQIIFTKPQQGNFVIQALQLDNNELVLLDDVPVPGSVTVNDATNEIIFSRHTSSEYIEEKSLVTKQTIRRVTSSSRDLYGQYMSKNDSVLFVSNRSGNWELWLKDKYDSKQLTDNVGLPFLPTTSPSGNRFAVVIKQPDEDNSQLFLGSLPDGKLIEVDNIDMEVVNPYWSLSEDILYFSGITDAGQGIYSYNVITNNIEQLTNSGEVFAVQGEGENLYVTRRNQPGIWQYQAKIKQLVKVVDELAAKDFGNFFWMDNALYYLKRSVDKDKIMRLNIAKGDENQEKFEKDEVVLSFPASSIRNYRAISPTTKQTILLSLHGVNDADIFSMKIN